MESDGVRIRAYLDSNSWSLHLAWQRNCWSNSERKVSGTSHCAESPTNLTATTTGTSASSSSAASIALQRVQVCSVSDEPVSNFKGFSLAHLQQATCNMSTSSHLTLFVALVLIAHSAGVQNINCPHRHCSRHL